MATLPKPTVRARHAALKKRAHRLAGLFTHPTLQRQAIAVLNDLAHTLAWMNATPSLAMLNIVGSSLTITDLTLRALEAILRERGPGAIGIA